MNTIKRGFSYWLRWLAVLPGSLVGGVLASIPLHFILYAALGNFTEPYPETPERLLTPAAMAGAFVYLGSRIAPEFKVEASVALFVLLMFLAGGVVFLTLSGAQWAGRSLYFQGGGVATVLAVVGALVALYLVRKEQKQSDESESRAA